LENKLFTVFWNSSLKFRTRIANMFGYLGRGALSIFPWLLDKRTSGLLSQLGYEPGQHGQIYTGLRLVLTFIGFLFAVFAEFGTAITMVSMMVILIYCLCLWITPNYFLARIAKHHTQGSLRYKTDTYLSIFLVIYLLLIFPLSLIVGITFHLFPVDK